MDPIDSNIGLANGLRINSASKDYLKEIAKWARFLAIVGFIGLGLVVIAIIAVLFYGRNFGAFSRIGTSESLIAVVYVAIIAIYYFPIKYLYKASINLRNGLNSEDESSLTIGFENLKSHYKFMGIFVIVILSLYALAAIIGLFAVAALN